MSRPLNIYVKQLVIFKSCHSLQVEIKKACGQTRLPTQSLLLQVFDVYHPNFKRLEAKDPHMPTAEHSALHPTSLLDVRGSICPLQLSPPQVKLPGHRLHVSSNAT